MKAVLVREHFPIACVLMAGRQDGEGQVLLVGKALVMTMRSLISAAHAAGYAMAPSEEYFHAADDSWTDRAVSRTPVAPEAVFHAPVPMNHPVLRNRSPETWLKGLFGAMLPRRAAA